MIASFKRIWRSGGRASLSLHAIQGELEARVWRTILMEEPKKEGLNPPFFGFVTLLYMRHTNNKICEHICFQFLCRHVWTFSLALLPKIVSMTGVRTFLRLQLSSRSARILQMSFRSARIKHSSRLARILQLSSRSVRKRARTPPRPWFNSRIAPAPPVQKNQAHTFTKRGERDETGRDYLFPFRLPRYNRHLMQKSPRLRCVWISLTMSPMNMRTSPEIPLKNTQPNQDQTIQFKTNLLAMKGMSRK